MTTDGPLPLATTTRKGLRLNTRRGLAIVVTPSWLLLTAFITVLSIPISRRVAGVESLPALIAIGLTVSVLMAASVLAHEMGHVAAARRYGIVVHEIRLYFVGRVSELSRPPARPGSGAVIAGAGPAVSGLLAGICAAALLVLPPQSVAWLIAAELGWINAILAAFNILPALPLDGGRVLAALVWRISGRATAGMTAGLIGGFVLAGLLACGAFGAVWLQGRSGLLLAAVFVYMSASVAAGAWSDRVSPGEPSPRPAFQEQDDDDVSRSS